MASNVRTVQPPPPVAVPPPPPVAHPPAPAPGAVNPAALVVFTSLSGRMSDAAESAVHHLREAASHASDALATTGRMAVPWLSTPDSTQNTVACVLLVAALAGLLYAAITLGMRTWRTPLPR